MPPRVDSVALLEHTMQMIREAHTNWNEDQILECAFSVMNLQPNTGQAEKIPKSVLSIVSQIVKLNENNWAIWEPMFMDCVCPVKNAKHILTGEIPDISKEVLVPITGDQGESEHDVTTSLGQKHVYLID
ncbi:uncharacterized protein UHOD_11343 [Ustilago sp. UG-2017b]|nr:uncharacterized protein UHOD_11343 [Ustilago sp. UG-2017b]